MNKREALKILNKNIEQADKFCKYNETSKDDDEYLCAIKIARDVLNGVVMLQDAFLKE